MAAEPRRGRPAAAVLAAALLLAGSQSGRAAGGDVAAVTTPGKGVLTICRDWFVYHSCSTYHHIAVPGRIAVGDRVELTYGSNPKDYVFHVVHIRPHGNGCMLLSDQSGPNGAGEKIEIARCHAAAKPAAAR